MTTWYVGKGADEDITVEFDVGASGSNPKIKFDSGTNSMDMAADGVNFSTVAESGGGVAGATLTLYNATGSQINAGQLVYVGARNVGESKYEAELAIATSTSSTTFYASWIASANVAASASGSFIRTKVLTGLDTSGGTVGRPAYLSTVAGGWLVALPDDTTRAQVVGQIIEVHASTGRIILTPQAPVEHESRALTVGADTDGHDVKFFGDSTGKYMLWDESADKLIVIGEVSVGVNDLGHDVKFFGDTDGKFMLWDTSADKLIVEGEFSATGAVTGATLVGTISTAIQNSITSATGLVSVGTVTSGTWSTGAVIGGVTVILGSDATGDVYYRNAGGVLTRLGVGSDADVLTLASGVPSWAAPNVGDITGVTAGLGLSGGGDSGTVSLALAFSELADTAIAHGDSIVFTDATDSNASVKGDLADVATLFAGTGLTASSSVIGVDASQTQITEVGTITTGVWSGSIDGDCVMNMGSDATGDVYFRDAAGKLEKLAASDSGHVLTSGGATTIPAWAAIPNQAPKAGDSLEWTDSTETVGDAGNAYKIDYFDLDHWHDNEDGYDEFVTKIQATSWHGAHDPLGDVGGDPPMHGCIYVNKDQDTVVWWNRDTQAIYMTWETESNDMITGTIAGAKAKDGILYVWSTDGLFVIDLYADSRVKYSTAGVSRYKGSIADRNSGSGETVSNAAPSTNHNSILGVAIHRDPHETDGIGRPLHWLAIWSADKTSIFDPTAALPEYRDWDLPTGASVPTFAAQAAMTIRDSATAYTGPVAIDSNGFFVHIEQTSTDVTYARYIYTHGKVNGAAEADTWAVAEHFGAMDWQSTAYDKGSALQWATSQTHQFVEVVDGGSWVDPAMPAVWLASETLGIYVLHPAGTAPLTTLSYSAYYRDNDEKGGKIRITEDYASPFMGGTCWGCWPMSSASPLEDASAQNKTLTNTGTVVFAEGGPCGGYGTFDGTNHLTMHQSTLYILDGGIGEYYSSCWFKAHADMTGADGYIMSVGADAGGANHWKIKMHTDGKIQLILNFSSGGAETHTTPGAYDDEQWHYCVAKTHNRDTDIGGHATDVKMWMDGEVVIDATLANEFASAHLNEIGIGAHHDTENDWFTGNIAGVVFGQKFDPQQRMVDMEYARGMRRLNGPAISTDDTIEDNDIRSLHVDSASRLVAIGGADKSVQIWDEFCVPIINTDYTGTTLKSVAVRGMANGADPHYVMAGDDKVQYVQPDTRLAQ